jgi:hypothetical protein
MGQQGQTGQSQMGQQGTTGERGRAKLTNEQRTRIRQTVLAGNNVPRVDHVNFALSVGTVVPSTVRFVAVPAALIDIHPAWRDDFFFVANDEIVIVDHSHKIVDVVPLGGGTTGAVERRGGGGSMASMSVEEIREVQMSLRRQGFEVEIDGKLGPRTREALVQFQRKHGLQATGEIDSRTRSALNSGGGSQSGAQGSNGGGMQQGGSQAPTTGQSGMQRQSGEQSRPSTAQEPSTQRNPTTGQGTGQSGSNPQNGMSGQSGMGQSSPGSREQSR